ncbi:MAG: transposase [Planctomycetes bacterium]|nr:transposase [Planctomycetota bacterium]
MAKICQGRYHIMAHMNKALNNVRKQEHRALMAEGDDTLIGSKNLWLYGRENLPSHHRDRFTTLKAANLATGRAYAIKETLRDLWSRANRHTATRHWKRWYRWASHSKLGPVMKAARTIKLHIANILTYFEHRITNALAEGINSKIQGIKKRACGFRNRDHFKTAILFHCGGLDLYPETPGH